MFNNAQRGIVLSFLLLQDQSDSVETLHISANEAFGKFKGKNLDSDNVDFSDRIRKSKKMG